VIPLNRQIFVLPLVACLLLVPALASPAMVAHEAQHAHHKAATHSSTLCAWFCGAGQASDVSEPVFVPTIDFVTTVNIEPGTRVHSADTLPFLSRGPPVRF
jgi:hypothetical protein